MLSEFKRIIYFPFRLKSSENLRFFDHFSGEKKLINSFMEPRLIFAKFRNDPFVQILFRMAIYRIISKMTIMLFQ